MFFMKVRRLPTASRVCIMCWRGLLRISSRVIKPCAVSMSPGAVVGIPTACRWKSRLKRNWDLPTSSRLRAYGIAKFNELCRESAFTYIQEWEKLTDRIGYWVDLKTAYITYKNEYIESVWWILKNFWDKGPALPGFQGGAVLPALRHTAFRP